MAYSLDLQDHVSFDIQATPVEILVPDGLSFQWILNGKAFAFVAANSTRRVVDAWIGETNRAPQDVEPKSHCVCNHQSLRAQLCDNAVRTPAAERDSQAHGTDQSAILHDHCAQRARNARGAGEQCRQ